MNLKIIILLLSLSVFFVACKNEADKHKGHTEIKESYTCPMHPQIIKDAPGNCPICGMKLVPKEDGKEKQAIKDTALSALLKPTNEFAISSIPTVKTIHKYLPLTLKALGAVSYDTRQMGSVSANISGRIEKLYVRSRYQQVKKGQRIMDIYSPEILTAQENLLMVLRNDPSNEMMISSAKQKLLLLGMSGQQLQEVIKKGKPDFSISVFSNYNGYIKDVQGGMPREATSAMSNVSQQTAELSVKEGMYVQKGQTVFNVYDPSKAWVVLNIYPQDMKLIKVGQRVNIVPDVAKSKMIEGKINFIEPFYQSGTKTITARVYFNNAQYKLPIGSQVEASFASEMKLADWIPSTAVLSLGLDKIVFVKHEGTFEAKKIQTGIANDQMVEIISGLDGNDQIAENAQYLMDSESFIKVNN